MCDESETKSTTTQKVPDYVEAGGKQLVSQASKLANKPYQSYTGERVADFTADQQTSFQAIRDLFTSGGLAIPGAQAYAAGPAQNVSTERIVDEEGKLGAINDYLNPYREAAIQPAIQAILDQQAAAQKRVGAAATSAGAFGDSRHGIMEASVDEATSQALGDTVGRFMSEGFDKSMAARSSDLDRFLSTDKLNADFVEQALKRQFEGTQAAGSEQMKNIQALLASGSLQQGQQQAKNDATYEEFLRKYGHNFSVLEALSAALTSAPYSKTSTTTETAPDNSMAGAAGSMGAAFLGTEAGAGMAAGLLAMI
jgi:hypothetical protein